MLDLLREKQWSMADGNRFFDRAFMYADYASEKQSWVIHLSKVKRYEKTIEKLRNCQSPVKKLPPSLREHFEKTRTELGFPKLKVNKCQKKAQR